MFFICDTDENVLTSLDKDVNNDKIINVNNIDYNTYDVNNIIYIYDDIMRSYEYIESKINFYHEYKSLKTQCCSEDNTFIWVFDGFIYTYTSCNLCSFPNPTIYLLNKNLDCIKCVEEINKYLYLDKCEENKVKIVNIVNISYRILKLMKFLKSIQDEHYLGLKFSD